jgi:protein phosphatase
MLEHPAEAFAYYALRGRARVVCEEKHMGSRAVSCVARDAEAARRRFGVGDGRAAVAVAHGPRVLRPTEAMSKSALLARLRAGGDATGFWESSRADWFLLDAELMPWSAKARALLRGQYAPVGAAATATLGRGGGADRRRSRAGSDAGPEAERLRVRRAKAEAFVAAYGRYCWDVASVDDLRLAPFHLLATEGAGTSTVDAPLAHDDARRAGRAPIPGVSWPRAGARSTCPTRPPSAEATGWWESSPPRRRRHGREAGAFVARAGAVTSSPR